MKSRSWQWKFLDGVITNLIAWSHTEDQAPFKDVYVSFLKWLYEMRDAENLGGASVSCQS